MHLKLRGVFVTGTDTGVGKTVVSAALMHRYRQPQAIQAIGVRYWKPIQTGIEQDDDTAEVSRLGNCQSSELLNEGIRLPRPLSPHLAARLAGTRIDLESVLARLTAAGSPQGSWVVEGAGGALVPINERDLMADLMSRLGLPVVVASRSSLGTINHTLLTLSALRSRGLHVAGVVMIGDPNPENHAAIETYGCVPVLGDMPRFDPLTSSAVGGWARENLDPNGILAL